MTIRAHQDQVGEFCFGLTFANAAAHFGLWPNDISRLQRGLKRDDTLAANYRQWLNTQLIDAT